MKKFLFWLSVWFVVVCMGFALKFWFLVENRAGIEVTEIDLVWFNPQWDGRGDDSFVKIDLWESVLYFLGYWLGVPLILAYGWIAAEGEIAAKERKKRAKREERIEDYAEALRRHEERNRDGCS